MRQPDCISKRGPSLWPPRPSKRKISTALKYQHRVVEKNIIPARIRHAWPSYTNVQCICCCTISRMLYLNLSFHQGSFLILTTSGGPLVYFCFSSSKRDCGGGGQCGPILLLKYSKEAPTPFRAYCVDVSSVRSSGPILDFV